MGILKKQSGLYDKEQACLDEQLTAEKYSKIAKSLNDLALSGYGGLATGDLTISVDAPWQDCVVDAMAPPAIQPWPATKEIRSRVSVPFRFGINAGQDEFDRVLEYAKQKIAMDIAEKLVVSGAIQFDRQVMHEYEFGQDNLVLEGSLTVV